MCASDGKYEFVGSKRKKTIIITATDTLRVLYKTEEIRISKIDQAKSIWGR